MAEDRRSPGLLEEGVRRLRVLVVDDEEGMRRGIERVLRNYRVSLADVDDDVTYEVIQAASGEGALASIAAEAPDIVLLDHQMPGITGLEVLRRLEGDHDFLTIMITAYASLENAISATKRGTYDFLPKPFTPAELKGVVEKASQHLMLQRETRRLAEEKRRLRFEFISVLAHELKAPIGAIEGYLRLLKDGTVGDDPATQRQFIDRSLLRLDGMRKLIFDLLDMTRIESGEKARKIESVAMDALLTQVLETLELQILEQKLAVTVEGVEGRALEADRSELEIILNNLLSNAVKYNRVGGRVIVRLVDDGAFWRIEVEDTGIGLEEGDAARLFRDFVRIKSEETRSIMGSGLGLSTVKKLAGLYGGQARVTSRPGEGSTFVVTLAKTQKAAPED